MLRVTQNKLPSCSSTSWAFILVPSYIFDPPGTSFRIVGDCSSCGRNCGSPLRRQLAFGSLPRHSCTLLRRQLVLGCLGCNSGRIVFGSLGLATQAQITMPPSSRFSSLAHHECH